MWIIYEGYFVVLYLWTLVQWVFETGVSLRMSTFINMMSVVITEAEYLIIYFYFFIFY